MIELSGDYGEGGGQLIRTACALAAVSGRDIHLTNIRANRPQPGLKTQHLEGLKALADLCNGSLEGASLGSREITFRPGKLSKTSLDVHVGTAGSAALVFQTLALPASQVGEEVVITLRGGATFGKWAPPLLATQHVLLPLLARMGFKASIQVERHGFYPAGGAQVTFAIQPWTPRPLELGQRGKVTYIGGISVASSTLRSGRVAERQARAAEDFLKRRGLQSFVKEQYVEADCPGSGLVLFAAATSGALLGGDSLGERGKPAEDVGKDAAIQLMHGLTALATADVHVADQILPFLALGGGSFSAPQLSEHAKTTIWVIQQLLPARFATKQDGDKVVVTCAGRSHNDARPPRVSP
ncbi:MAG: RNA 3'-terminal phosphate cyclase [Candidatus Aenigmarchaeota archaeon]|nr:RNA 3'-terminal phosphate cyclase [Candidatus Aenigmarchaeota archaeon]